MTIRKPLIIGLALASSLGGAAVANAATDDSSAPVRATAASHGADDAPGHVRHSSREDNHRRHHHHHAERRHGHGRDDS